MPSGYSGPDRRNHKRIKVNFMVLYSSQDSLDRIKVYRGKEIYALMLDLSETGMAVLTEYDIPPSSALELKFTLPALHKITRQNLPIPISVKGQVKYSRAMGKDGFRIGIIFTEIGAGDRNLIASFISNC